MLWRLNIRTDFAANAPRFRRNAGLVVRLVLDVPSEDLFEDLSLAITAPHVGKTKSCKILEANI